MYVTYMWLVNRITGLFNQLNFKFISSHLSSHSPNYPGILSVSLTCWLMR